MSVQTDAKTCSRCGYYQIIEAFPLHKESRVKGSPIRRSYWCRECWKDHHAETKARKRAAAA